MNFEDLIIRNDEKAIFTLRSLYRSFGYSQFKMRKFEEYDLYAKNKDFLISDNIITFTDTNGKLMAMKPDVTLSLIKNTKDLPGVQKLFYNENVYRVSGRTKSFNEIMQVGLECIGEVGPSCISEVLSLAAESLLRISGSFALDISHLGIISSILDRCAVTYSCRERILRCISEKNPHELSDVCREAGIGEDTVSLLNALAVIRGKPSEILPEIRSLASGAVPDGILTELENAVLPLESSYGDAVSIDFSVVNDMNYYNGIVFRGFISSVPSGVLSGGQYDTLMKKMGRTSSAIGFAVYLDDLDRADSDSEAGCSSGSGDMINIALPKGRLGEKVYSLFEQAGYECPSILDESRKLIFENPACGVRYFWVKPSDVAIYVERGAADIGIAGKDILLEYEPDVYELADLHMGKCRMAVAAPKSFTDCPDKTLRVATKFSNIAGNYYASLGRDIDIIHLNGSIEIAPILGLSDVIVDIVETGTTLKENDLEVIETIVPISARLIANKSGTKFKGEKINEIVRRIAALTEETA